ncbi:MerR family transcriptional regulator [Insolitispirillum peregrinum]|uniref:DNA-binding transcriptional regulator, MerR family n=1 Tax=Insolitispirillum peregrinum TaxID=80876 RepID=A0A1N7L3M2_9PROT|nr:helix-turn-helix domain-containing protein [Insolitispirillum peregrinum]SIS68459.1 DNA-binding transcriptional regulator, MerR family [Insolitispirillum peregrinum]
MSLLTIGKLAEATGVKVPTIRYYESVGLLPEPPRTDSNRRLYDQETVRRLRFIRHAREMGFETDAIRDLLRMAAQPDRSCRQADGIARAHLTAIDDKIARLTALRDEIEHMLADCPQDHIYSCKVIEVLADHSHCLHAEH